jgi:hypothetical protein
MKDKKLSRVKNIMGKYNYIPKRVIPKNILREYNINKILGLKTKELEIFFGVNPKSVEHRERLEVFNYFHKLGMSDEDVRENWYEITNAKYERRRWINGKPTVERKDNLNPKTNTVNRGSGGGGYSSIRVPSKKHKNRYKNFLKLFPNYVV